MLNGSDYDRPQLDGSQVVEVLLRDAHELQSGLDPLQVAPGPPLWQFLL